MTDKEIIRMAREAGIPCFAGMYVVTEPAELEHFAALVRAEALAEQEKQEPVAVISESAIGLVKLHSNGACLPFGTQLYAAPVSAKREWVDLTDYEIEELPFNRVSNDPLNEYARAVIAADREKNK